MRGKRSRLLPSVCLLALVLVVVIAVPAPAAPVAITIPYSSTAVADTDLDGNPGTGAWSDATSWTITLENGASSPYGTATLYAKHDGSYVYFRVDGKIDVAWTSSSGNHFWFGMQFSLTGTSHHSGSGSWDGVFFGESAYTPAPTYPPLAVDTNGFSKPPAKDTAQNDLGKMGYSGSSAPYSFTVEWKRALSTGDSQDVTFTADGTAKYNFYATTDSDGGGSSGGAIDHSKVSNLNTMTFQKPPSTDTTPPTVSITSPASGALLRGTATLTSAASDNVGVVKVEFYVDSVLKGTVTTSPYSFAWDTTTSSDGTHALSAKAYDAATNVGTSAAVSVTTDNTAPAAAITAPTASSYVRGTVTISATASDANGISLVEFDLDGAPLGTDTTSPYTVSWDTSTAAETMHALTAKATDTPGNVGTSPAISVTVDRTAPVARAGAARLVSPGTVVAFDGSASTDANGVANYTWTFTDSAAKTLYTVNPSYTFNNLGSFTITLTAADPAGNTGTGLTWVNVTADTQPPVARAGPAQAVLQGTLVTLNGSLSTDDVGIANYTWTFTDVSARTLWGSVVSYRFLHVANIAVTLTARDYSGKTGTATTWVNVSADSVAPVAKAGPDQFVDRGTLVNLNGTMSTDNVGIANYTWTFTDGGTVTLYGARVSRQFMNVGNFSVTLTVRDYTGNTGSDSAWVNVTPDQVPPVAVIELSPGHTIGIVQWIALSGTNSTDNVGVVNYTWTFTDGAPVSLYGALASYRFRHSGNVTITLTVSDLAGNIGVAATWVDVSAVPVVASAGPDRSVVLGGTVLLDGSNSTGNGGIVNYTWRVEPTSFIFFGSIANYTPVAGGVQTVNLTVTDAADLKGSTTFQLTVVVADTTPPAALGLPTVTSLGPGSVQVSWSPSNAPDLAGYLVLRSSSPDGPFVQLNLVPASNTTYVDEGLVPGATYYYRVVAVDRSGNPSSPSPIASGAAGAALAVAFDWMTVRWAVVPLGSAAALLVLGLLARREARRRKRPRSPPTQEGSR